MTGEDLYLLYAEALEHVGVGADEWLELEDTDRAAWDALALQVRPA